MISHKISFWKMGHQARKTS